MICLQTLKPRACLHHLVIYFSPSFGTTVGRSTELLLSQAATRPLSMHC